MTPGRLGLLGGTFDPIHCGHLDAAEAARAALALDVVWIMPARTPPHRPGRPTASAYHRFAMVALAVADRPGLLASDFELIEEGPSYTARTLDRLAAAGWRPWQIVFITGADAFADIASWHDYPAVLDRAHFAVVSRPGTPVASLRARLPALAPRMQDVRGRLEPGRSPAIFLIDAPTTAVSATEVRRRLQTGEPIDRLVPPAVADHARRHGLYTPAAAAVELHEER
ncbi:MAG TPA: nicotinate-nucleotide adenylyltransferase [Vicinamibacterales bacterium]|jgi:nicotinate-nucleotide adenylyltransferase|nr:nicotinate-nucleotide adenylyltransferase [Vicinamibacterales bacterium]